VKARVWISVGALAAAGLITWAVVRPDRISETNSITPAHSASPAHTSVPPAYPSPTSPPAADSNEPLAAAAQYPVVLDELRTRLPGNRYWELGVPTSDPEVARARAERAKRDNAIFGRTQTGEATEPEIRAYYAERRRISEDYLQLAMLVLEEKSDQLPDRDRTLFALSAKLHRERLTQIERDLTDALARRRDRQR
jgi:hypothetical protein